MATEVLMLNFNRKKGKLYYISNDGDLVEMDAATKDKTLIPGSQVKKLKGYLYFLNKNGNIARVRMRNHSRSS
ncbi:MAG: hypothetical protein KDD04_07670 [Sinomicrobium sp.]|nr:hypothetical protein [Sinomicrobium sp.]